MGKKTNLSMQGPFPILEKEKNRSITFLLVSDHCFGFRNSNGQGKFCEK